MSDLKSELENKGLRGTSMNAAQKRCKCGNPIKNPKYDICYDCSQKKYAGATASLPGDYLSNGYFKEQDILYEDLVTKTADTVAASFKGLKNHQLRRFYQHVRDAANKLKMTGDWQSVNIDIKKLKAFSAEAKGKCKIPETFYQFIVKNVDCVKDEKTFIKGFLEHFQAVMGYFTYYNPKD